HRPREGRHRHRRQERQAGRPADNRSPQHGSERRLRRPDQLPERRAGRHPGDGWQPDRLVRGDEAVRGQRQVRPRAAASARSPTGRRESLAQRHRHVRLPRLRGGAHLRRRRGRQVLHRSWAAGGAHRVLQGRRLLPAPWCLAVARGRGDLKGRRAEGKMAEGERPVTVAPPEAERARSKACEQRGSPHMDVAVISGVTFARKAVTYYDVDGVAIIEGDIALGSVSDVKRLTEQARSAASYGDARTYGVGIPGQSFRWPDCLMPYTIDPELPEPE